MAPRIEGLANAVYSAIVGCPALVKVTVLWLTA